MSQTRTTRTTKTTTGAAKHTGDVFADSQRTFEQLFQAATEAWSGNYDKWIKFNQERTNAILDSFKGWDEVGADGRETVEAWMASGRIAAKGIEEVTEKWLAFVTAALEDNVAASREMLGCKDVKQLVDLQSKQIRKFVDTWMAEGAELSELSLQTATKAMSPIGERFNAAVEKASQGAR